MTRHTAAIAVSAPLTTAIRTWLALGLAALALLPAARGHSLLLGWLPFWLVLAPLLMLAVAEHRQMAAMLRALAVRRRRLHARRPQARLLRTRRAQRRAA